MDKRHEYAQRIKAGIDRWNRDVDDLEAELADASDSTRAEIRKDLDAARAKRDELLRRLSQLKNVAEDAWDDVTAEVDNAWAGIQRSLERAAGRVSR